jgi:hypothetical protein
VKTVPLTKGVVAIVDDDDFERVIQFKWHTICQNGKPTYGARHYRKPDGSRGLQYLHKFIMRSETLHDHENGNGFDCRKENLRPATTKQNVRNRKAKRTSNAPYKGISRRGPTWNAKIVVDGKSIFLGASRSAEDAARLYDMAALKFFGEFARLNFNRSNYPQDVNLIELPKKRTPAEALSYAARIRWARYRGEAEPWKEIA